MCVELSVVEIKSLVGFCDDTQMAYGDLSAYFFCNIPIFANQLTYGSLWDLINDVGWASQEGVQ